MTTYTSNTTWTSDADIPAGDWFIIDLYGPGAGGQGGQAFRGSSSTQYAGGAGGGAGAHQRVIVSRAAMDAALPITFTLPAGGAGGAQAARSTNGLSGPNNGTAPTSGAAIVGTALKVFAGAGAAATGATTGAAGGGQASDGSTNTPGGPRDAIAIGAVSWSDHGGGVPNLRTLAGAGFQSISIEGGAGSGTGNNPTPATSTPGLPGGIARYGGGGGGAGGSADALTTTFGQGGDGGGHDITLLSTPFGGGGGTAVTNGVGNNGAAATELGGGTGGAGGAGDASASASVTGKAGGSGGAGGGGGGGGGSGSSSGGTVIGGAGGNGGSAMAIIQAISSSSGLPTTNSNRDIDIEAGGVSFAKSPLSHWWFEDFTFIETNGTISTSQASVKCETPWQMAGINASATIDINSSTSHPGNLVITTGAAAGNGLHLFKGRSLTTALPYIATDVAYLCAIFKLSSTTNIDFQVGLSDSIGGLNTNAALFYVYATTGTLTWHAYTSKGGVGRDTDTGVALTTNYVRFEALYDGTQWKYYIGGTLVDTASSSANIPTGSVDFALRVATRTTAALTCTVDYLALKSKPLAR